MKSLFCQNEDGQIAPVYSISAGLDYPGIGPEHAYLHDTKRAVYVPVTDVKRWRPLNIYQEQKGLSRQLRAPTAIAYAMKYASTLDKDKIIVVNVSGGEIKMLPPLQDIEEYRFMSKISDAFKNGKAFIGFITGGDPNLETTKKLILEMEENGADIVEIGIPFQIHCRGSGDSGSGFTGINSRMYNG